MPSRRKLTSKKKTIFAVVQGEHWKDDYYFIESLCGTRKQAEKFLDDLNRSNGSEGYRNGETLEYGDLFYRIIPYHLNALPLSIRKMLPKSMKDVDGL